MKAQVNNRKKNRKKNMQKKWTGESKGEKKLEEAVLKKRMPLHSQDTQVSVSHGLVGEWGRERERERELHFCSWRPPPSKTRLFRQPDTNTTSRPGLVAGLPTKLGTWPPHKPRRYGLELMQAGGGAEKRAAGWGENREATLVCPFRLSRVIKQVFQ